MKFDAFKRNKAYLSLAVAMIMVFAGVAFQSAFGESEAAGSSATEPDAGQALVSLSSTNTDTLPSVAPLFVGVNTIADIAEQVSKSVVTIEAMPTVSQRPTTGQSPFGDPFNDPFFDMFRYFFGTDPYGGRNPEDYATSSGTGFVFTADGYILTNNHLVSENKKIMVTLADGTEYEAQIVRRMDNPDVAVLKVDPGDNELVPVKIGKSSEVRPGEWAIAIGNPLNLGITVTAGIVSATHRGDDPKLRQMFGNVQVPPSGFIQTDAAINRGNSGGPLVNLTGEVIGINTAMALDGQNVGFATPIDVISDLLPKLMTEAKGGYLGVGLYDIDKEFAARLGVSTGAVVGEVYDGFPADNAGIRVWDVIVKIDDQDIRSRGDVSFIISSHEPGDEIEIVFVREGTLKAVKAELAEAPKE